MFESNEDVLELFPNEAIDQFSPEKDFKNDNSAIYPVINNNDVTNNSNLSLPDSTDSTSVELTLTGKIESSSVIKTTTQIYSVSDNVNESDNSSQDNNNSTATITDSQLNQFPKTNIFCRLGKNI